MTTTLTCPDRIMWKHLVDGSLPPAQCDELTTHLDTCIDCQTTVETLAEGDRPLSISVPHDGHGVAECTPALDRVIAQFNSWSNASGVLPVTTAGVEPQPTFLDPPYDPTHLGQLGRYGILEVLRRGGMGWVFKAVDPKLNRIVAIKVIAPQLAGSSAARQRFAREAHAVGAIRHAHVIDVYSVEETSEGVPYLVMAFIDGMSLQERLDQNGALPLRDVLRIGRHIAEGLAAAHARGLIHRDIKPGNILLETSTNRALVSDFGLARAVDDVSLTQSGVAAGTPQYMSPEQARGESADQRGDLFSLGSVLYAMCTGHPPFRAKANLAVLNQICEATPQPIREINPGIPEWLVGVIAKLHAKRPEDRFASVAEVATALERQVALPAPRRRIPKWAAIVLLALFGLAAAEASGVTNLASVVIRIFTPDGTLVVEIDDPAIRVAIENDGKEVVVTGPSIQELRLRTGAHKIHATQDGKPLALKEDVVIITRGEKRILRISREDVAALGVQQRLDQAVSLYERGARLRTEDSVAAERILRQSISTFERLAAESPNDNRYPKHLEQCRWYLGSTLNLQSARLINDPPITDAKVKRALALSAEATKLMPNDYGIVHTLAMCHYRAKDWKAALAMANKSVSLTGGARSEVWFLLSMVHWQLGDKAKARENYDLAVAWMDRNPQHKELPSRKVEAAQLLGITSPGK